MPPRPPPPAPIPPRPFDFDNGLKNAGSRFTGIAGATSGTTSGSASGVSGQSGISGQGGAAAAGGGSFAGNGQLGGGVFGGLIGGFGGGGGGKAFGLDGGSLYPQGPSFKNGVGIFGGTPASSTESRALTYVEPSFNRPGYRPVTFVRSEQRLRRMP